MTFRRISFVVVLLVLGAVATWWWTGKVGPHPVASAEKPTPAAAPSPTAHGHAMPAPGGSSSQATVFVSPPRVTTSVAPGSPQVRTVSSPSSPDATAATARAEPPASRPDSQPEGRTDLQGVRFMLRDFRTRLGENPVGSNAEIMRAVMGGNSAGARLGPPAGQSLNADGELVDRWGTPYFFHQLARNNMEIRSAGPDRQMWTADDLVAK